MGEERLSVPPTLGSDGQLPATLWCNPGGGRKVKKVSVWVAFPRLRLLFSVVAVKSGP